MKLNMVKTCILLVAGFTMATAQAQSTGNDPVLFTVAGQPVTKEEFLYVYKKTTRINKTITVARVFRNISTCTLISN